MVTMVHDFFFPLHFETYLDWRDRINGFFYFFIGARILMLLILGIVVSHKYAIYEPTEAFANKEIDILLIVYRILRN